MANIKNIIFDYGGVFLTLDEDATYRSFQNLGLFAVTPSLAAANMDFQRGRISSGKFISAIKKELPEDVTDQQVKDAWCAMLGTIPRERIDLLKILRRKYRLFLLSNTDDIHIERVNSTVPDVGEFLSLFEKVYYSQDTGYRKPEKEIFGLVLRENNLKADECLFVDDVKENAEGAGVVGMKYLWLDLSRHTVMDVPRLLDL